MYNHNVREAHEESKTVLVDDLAALEAEIQPFQWFVLQGGPISKNQNLSWNIWFHPK